MRDRLREDFKLATREVFKREPLREGWTDTWQDPLPVGTVLREPTRPDGNLTQIVGYSEDNPMYVKVIALYPDGSVSDRWTYWTSGVLDGLEIVPKDEVPAIHRSQFEGVVLGRRILESGTWWEYETSSGVTVRGQVEDFRDYGGTDVTYIMRREDGTTDVLSGSRLKAARVIHRESKSGRDLKETALDNPSCPVCGGASVFTGKGNSHGAFLGSVDTWSLDWFECLRCKEQFSTQVTRDPGQRYTSSTQGAYDYESKKPKKSKGLSEKVKPTSVEDKHQLKVLKQLLRAPDAMVGVMGGGYNSKEEVRDVLRSKFGWSDSEISSFENSYESKRSRKAIVRESYEDEEHYRAMLDLGVKWSKRNAVPTYPSSMSQYDKDEADRHYDALSQEFLDSFGDPYAYESKGQRRFSENWLVTVGLGKVAETIASYFAGSRFWEETSPERWNMQGEEWCVVLPFDHGNVELSLELASPATASNSMATFEVGTPRGEALGSFSWDTETSSQLYDVAKDVLAVVNTWVHGHSAGFGESRKSRRMKEDWDNGLIDFPNGNLRYVGSKHGAGSTSEHSTYELVSGEWPSDEELVQALGGSWGGAVHDNPDGTKTVSSYSD